MPAAEDCQGARLQTDGSAVSAAFLFWAPFVLCFPSIPFHTVTSSVSKEQYATAKEIFCWECKDVRFWSHRTAVFCANSDDPAE